MSALLQMSGTRTIEAKYRNACGQSVDWPEWARFQLFIVTLGSRVTNKYVYLLRAKKPLKHISQQHNDQLHTFWPWKNFLLYHRVHMIQTKNLDVWKLYSRCTTDYGNWFSTLTHGSLRGKTKLHRLGLYSWLQLQVLTLVRSSLVQLTVRCPKNSYIQWHLGQFTTNWSYTFM